MIFSFKVQNVFMDKAQVRDPKPGGDDVLNV